MKNIFSLMCLLSSLSLIQTNNFLTKFANVDYSRSDLHENHLRVARSLDNQIKFTLKTDSNETFSLKLVPSANSHFKDDLRIELQTTAGLETQPHEAIIYEGYLLDEPETSEVHGSIIEGLFTGSIRTKNGTYFVESNQRYTNQTEPQAHSIIYHETDIKNVDSLGCGARSETVREHLQTEQNKIPKPIKVSKRDTTLEDSLFKYTKEANLNKARHKRATQSTFPLGKSVCSLYLKIDPYYYNEIFKNEGNSNTQTTVNYITAYLTRYVANLNAVFKNIQFFANTNSYYQGVQFQIHRLKILTDATCAGSSLTTVEKQICQPYLDAVTFLNYASLDDYSDYCLGYTFTARDFSTGTLGLAWVASDSGSVGGVCENSASIQGVKKSLNTGIVTINNYNSRVPEVVTLLTFTHEVGHSFGSGHDPEGACSPGGTNGNYIMYSRATTGLLPNNKVFSSCSLSQMGTVLSYVVANKFCFILSQASVCGNGIIESGEECDCGFPDQCTETCCDSTTCKRRSGAVCSPSEGACCEADCSFSSSSKTCSVSSDCKSNVLCSGNSATCSNSSAGFKADLTACNGQTQVCISGECTGSICQRFQMTQCYIQGNLSDPKVDKRSLCRLACVGSQTNNVCTDSFQIPAIVNTYNEGVILKPGSACSGTDGYCDVFSNCRSANTNGVLARLASTLLSPSILSDIKQWVETYWWAILIFVIIFLVLFNLVIWALSKLMPSSNPSLQVKINKTYPKNQSLRKAESHSSQIALTSKRRSEKPTVFTTDVADYIDDDRYAPRNPVVGSGRRSAEESSDHKLWKPVDKSQANILDYNDTVYNGGILNAANDWNSKSQNEKKADRELSAAKKPLSILRKPNRTSEESPEVNSKTSSSDQEISDFNDKKILTKTLAAKEKPAEKPRTKSRLVKQDSTDKPQDVDLESEKAPRLATQPISKLPSLSKTGQLPEINAHVVKKAGSWVVDKNSKTTESVTADERPTATKLDKKETSDAFEMD